ncbi:MAG: CDP-archaeol synthase [Alphaproteobacteria bacterium]|nr:CDP-archaeol synthase [Alphaproteobacteria bacterium]
MVKSKAKDNSKSKLNSFLKRVATSLVLIPVVIACIIFGYPTLYLLALLGAALLSWEWASMVPNSRPTFYAMNYFFVAMVAVLMNPIIIPALVMVVAFTVAFCKSKGEDNRKLLLLGVPYIACGIGSIVSIYSAYGPYIVLWFMFVVWGVDIGGYLVGSTVKGPKLAPKISPNKTWSGLLGGILLAVAVSYGVMVLFKVSPQVSAYYLIMAGIIAAIAQVGDLIESYIKRRLDIKDSSNLIPGHGGIFDRIDGLIFAAPFAYLMLANLAKIVK